MRNKFKPKCVFFDLDWTLIAFPNIYHNYQMIENSSSLLVKNFQNPFLGKYFFSYALLKVRREIVKERSQFKSFYPNDLKPISDCIIHGLFKEIMKCNSLRKYENSIIDRINNAYATFYSQFMPEICKTIQPYPLMVNIVKECKKENIKTVLVTNPLSTVEGISYRLAKTGLELNDFHFVTAAENMRFLKPNRDYYQDVLNLADAEASEVIMIGNDFKYDGAAKKLGIKTIILQPRISDKVASYIAKKMIFG